MADMEKKTGEIAEAVTGGFQKIEDGVVGGYKKVEGAVVGAFQGIEDKFVARYLTTHDGETVEQAKEQLSQEQAAHMEAQKTETENVPQNKKPELRPASRNGPSI